MTSLPSILILGPDAVAAANPATPVQLVHACRQWGFSSVVPSSWGDELIATEVVRRCGTLTVRPVIQCSCPRVSDRLAKHAAILDDAILWLVSPPVAVAKYVKSLDPERLVHVVYAGGCPGGLDPSIDEVISPFELLAGISARGIDVNAQPRVFENVIPADRRRHASTPGGLPDQHHLWERSSYRVVQPTGADASTRVAQLLLNDDRVLIDLAPSVGCLCRAAHAEIGSELHRSPTPVVAAGHVDLSIAPPVIVQPREEPAPPPPPPVEEQPAETVRVERASPPRLSAARPAYRRSVTWRRVSPRPGVVLARPSATMLALTDRLPLLQRPAARWAIVGLIAAGVLMLGVWLGRRTNRLDQPSGDRRAIQFPSAPPGRAPAL